MSRPPVHPALLTLLALALAACTGGTGTGPLPGPTVESVAPSRLPPGGGPVTISGEHFFEVTSGTGFARALTVTVCGLPLQDLTVDGEERTLLAPPGHSVTIRVGDTLAGTLAAPAEASSPDVVVTRPDGATAILANAIACHAEAPTNDVPRVTITEPSDATRIEPGDSVTLAATAHDAEDGDLTSTVTWSSDLDGALGTGATLTTSSLSIGTHIVSATVVDADGASGSASVAVWVDGGFVDSGQDLVGGEGWWNNVAVGDLDGDGDLDAFIAHGRSSSVLLNDGAGRFSEVATVAHPSSASAVKAALGDLDGDGDLDAHLVGDSPRIVLLNDGTGTFIASGQDLGPRNTWSDVALGDVDGDGDLDAAISSHSSAPGAVYLNDGTGLFTDSGQTLAGGGYAVAIGDVDGDGDVDVLSTGWSSYVYPNDGSGGFTHGSSFGTGGSDVTLGDLDGDSDLDAFLGQEWAADGVYLNDGTGTFTGGDLALGLSATLGVALGDVDGDGDLDAFLANGNGEPNRVYRNDGSGAFTDSGQRLGAASSSAVALADLDGDGKLDAFVLNSDGGSRVYLRQ